MDFHIWLGKGYAGEQLLSRMCSAHGFAGEWKHRKKTDRIRDGCCYVFVVEGGGGGGGAGTSSVNESRFSLLRFLPTFAMCAFCPTLGGVLSTSKF